MRWRCERGRPLIFDPNLRLHRWRSDADAAAAANACVPGALLVRANRAEAALMTGEDDPERAAMALVRAGARVVGGHARGRRRDRAGSCAPTSPGVPARVISTVGAGDVLAGILLARLAVAGFEPSAVAAALPEAVEQSARACERWGALE